MTRDVAALSRRKLEFKKILVLLLPILLLFFFDLALVLVSMLSSLANVFVVVGTFLTAILPESQGCGCFNWTRLSLYPRSVAVALQTERPQRGMCHEG